MPPNNSHHEILCEIGWVGCIEFCVKAGGFGWDRMELFNQSPINMMDPPIPCYQTSHEHSFLLCLHMTN